MKLAEVLAARKDIKQSLDDLRTRMCSNVTVQEGDTAAEDVERLFDVYRSKAERLTELTTRIYQVNNLATLEFEGRELTVAEALALKEELAELHGAANAIVAHAAARPYRLAHAEIKQVKTVNVAEWQRRRDDAAKRLRQLDVTIQAANWATDVNF